MRYSFIFLLVLSISFSLQTNANHILYNLSDGQKLHASDVMFLNDHTSNIHLFLNVEGDVSKFIKIKNPEMDIPKGEVRWVEYEIFIPEGTKTGEYAGYIVATLNGEGEGARINLALKKRITISVSGKEEPVDFLEFLLSLAVLLMLAYMFLSIISNAKKRFIILFIILAFAPFVHAPSQDISAGVEILYTCGIINEPTNLDFGSFVSGQYSQVKNTTVTNTGNVDVDISLHGTDWIKTGGGSFSVENTKYSLDNSNYFDLTSAPTIIYSDLSPGSTLDIFFKVYVPQGNSGRYEQSITVGGICP
ncbi:MAG: hypothetical protein QXY05_01920 [Candidatus Anstonellales archaeon]